MRCAQEAAPYKGDPEVLAMTNLVAAYQANDILAFEKILRTNRCANLHGAVSAWKGCTQHLPGSEWNGACGSHG